MAEPAVATDEATAIWSKAREALLSDGSMPQRYKACIEDVTPFRCLDDLIVLNVTSQTTRSILEDARKARPLLTRALSEAAGRDMGFALRVVSAPVESEADDDSPDAIALMAKASKQRRGKTAAPAASAATAPASPRASRRGRHAAPLPDYATALIPDPEPTPTEAAPASAAANAAGAAGAGRGGDVPEVRDKATNLNTALTFDTFVIGDSNRFAHTIAMSVAEAPGQNFNPLCIYGGPGLGKTHLLNAIGNEALRENPKLKVRYVNSEEYQNEFIEAIAKGNQTSDYIARFNRKYREVDVLLIDDVQFLRGEETMRQFFHTFNALYEAGKQIVVASDVAPKNLKNFEERLISRFNSGLSVDVKPPDLDTRIAILRMKAQNDGLEVPNEIINVIAEKVTDNVRELQGALTRMHALESLDKQPLTRDVAEQALKDMVSGNSEITVTDIIAATAHYYQLTSGDLVSKGRTKRIATARQIAMYLTHEMTSMSLVDIGRAFGGRDHTTVIYACKKISTEMTEKREIYTSINELTVEIRRTGGEGVASAVSVDAAALGAEDGE